MKPTSDGHDTSRSQSLQRELDCRHNNLTSMPGTTGETVASGPQHCAMMANFTADMFEALMIERIESNDSVITIEDVHAVCRAVKTTPPDLWSYFRHHYSHCIDAALTDQGITIEPRTPLRRLIASTFSHLFPDNPSYRPGSQTLPRILATGFFNTLPRVIGDDNVHQLSIRCEQVVNAMQRELGIDFDWSGFFQHHRSRNVLDDLRALLAERMVDYDKRVDWLAGMLSQEIGSPVKRRQVEVLLDSLFVSWLQRANMGTGTARRLFGALGEGEIAIADLFDNEVPPVVQEASR